MIEILILIEKLLLGCLLRPHIRIFISQSVIVQICFLPYFIGATRFLILLRQFDYFLTGWRQRLLNQHWRTTLEWSLLLQLWLGARGREWRTSDQLYTTPIHIFSWSLKVRLVLRFHSVHFLTQVILAVGAKVRRPEHTILKISILISSV